MPAVVVATAYGGPEVLSVVDQPTPAPGPGEVVVGVRAVGMNPIDWKVYSGMMGDDPAALPQRLGSEAAGTVLAVGPDSTDVAVGDEVIAFRAPGAYAAELVTPRSAVVPKPATLPFEAAAGLMLAGTTAVHALTVVDVSAGDTVLVHGGAGGVGLLVLQLAAARGATVLATASPAKHDVLRRFGAVPLAYGDGLLDRVRAAAPDGIDAALDLVGTDEAVDTSLALVADRGRIVSIAAFGRGGDGIKLIGGAPGADPGTELRDRARYELAELAGRGELEVVVSKTYPLAEVVQAHRDLKAGHATGKLVLTV